MEEKPLEATEVDIHISMFPHLTEFLVLDGRSNGPREPYSLVISTQEVFTPAFFKGLQGAFQRACEEVPEPFLNLMSLSQRVEMLVRHRSLRAILEKIDVAIDQQPHLRVAVLLCIGAALGLTREQVSDTVNSAFSPAASQEARKTAIEAFLRLQTKEHSAVRALEVDDLRNAIRGQSQGFRTLWQSPN